MQWICRSYHNFALETGQILRQLAVAAANSRGEFVFLSNPSRGASDAGITIDSVIGHKFWDFVDAKSAKVIRESFQRCLIDQTRQHFTNTSTIDGNVEHWQTLMLPCHGAEVVAISQEILEATDIQLSSEERETVRMLADDHTIDEIADNQHTTASAISSRLLRVRAKCGVHTNHGLVAWCLRYGVI